MKTFEQTLHVCRPNIGDRERFNRYIDKIFDNGRLTNHGELVQELEEMLAEYLGVRHCILMCNGTVALEIAIRALELKGEVIIPSFTFIATAHALQWQGITPVFCDIAPNSYCIDIKEIETHITTETTAIIGVHLYGCPCDIDALQSIANKHGLKLLFDAAHAFACSYNGTMIGNFGDCEVFSFHATKVFNSFEGGVVATNNDNLSEKIRLMQNFGFKGIDDVIYIGTNGKMTEICAAMGLTNLKQLDEFIEANRCNYYAYKLGFSEIKGLKLIEYNEREKCNWQYVVVEVGEEYPLSRDELMDNLNARNIRVRRYFWPGCHRSEPYATLQPNVGAQLTVTEETSSRVLVFPTGTAVTQEMVKTVISECKY